jgi:hypothetical protein
MQPPGGSSNRSSNLVQLLHARQTGVWDAGWRSWQLQRYHLHTTSCHLLYRIQQPALCVCRLLSLDLSRSCYLRPTNHGGVLVLAADPVERRYLLSGAADSTLEVFDVQVGGTPGAWDPQKTHWNQHWEEGTRWHGARATLGSSSQHKPRHV